MPIRLVIPIRASLFRRQRGHASLATVGGAGHGARRRASALVAVGSDSSGEQWVLDVLLGVVMD
ncbi:MAG: hypothetical protein ACXVCO_19005, partial [Ktedonobacterales bacterium]